MKIIYQFLLLPGTPAKITQKCVDTINKYIPGTQIIVVDNGSQDNTVLLLSKIKNVEIITNHANLGFAKANNIGLKHATSDHIIFMNSDIELLDKTILNMVDYLKNNPNIGLIGLLRSF
jgi:GT2 family glycosyltransferase